jgi:hypothetical protein
MGAISSQRPWTVSRSTYTAVHICGITFIPDDRIERLMIELPFYNQSIQAIAGPTIIFGWLCTTTPD